MLYVAVRNGQQRVRLTNESLGDTSASVCDHGDDIKASANGNDFHFPLNSISWLLFPTVCFKLWCPTDSAASSPTGEVLRSAAVFHNIAMTKRPTVTLCDCETINVITETQGTRSFAK
ncbi:hypothetical protein F2P81_000987 [Scophthalmus maximus]|uniref:Uncharacterized protein n=1 Tax=Scophthalmus maximus TaxID=52904 RepID=A0A6A4TW30_SCOMX|nr:hypothetical protein F2P81_000987 [Scophthalmus maximus]